MHCGRIGTLLVLEWYVYITYVSLRFLHLALAFREWGESVRIAIDAHPFDSVLVELSPKGWAPFPTVAWVVKTKHDAVLTHPGGHVSGSDSTTKGGWCVTV
jgi:hypothetical protein